MDLWARGYALDAGVCACVSCGTVQRDSLTKVEVNTYIQSQCVSAKLALVSVILSIILVIQMYDYGGSYVNVIVRA